MSNTDSVILDVQKLNKRFGEVYAVKDLSFQVKRGEVFGFLGPNGAGKSTTMRIVTCFIPATSGSIKVDGQDIHEYSLQIRKKIGYLPENTPLYNDMLVNEYLAFVGKLRGLQDKKLSSAMDAVYQTCGLTTVVKRQIGKLSKGFRQRVGLAQAMIHNPDLLILDEPTSGLDPNQIVEIRELIKKLGTEKTVVYCSHILPEVSATCSRILIINEGSAVATGTAEELTSQSGKGNLYRMRIKADRESAESKLSTLPVVSKVKIESSSDGWLEVLVAAEGKIDVGEDLFKSVVQNGWSLAELRRETTSLEETFAQLTRG